MAIASVNAHDAHDAALRNKGGDFDTLKTQFVQKCSKDSDWTQFVSLGGSARAVDFSIVVILFLENLHFSVAHRATHRFQSCSSPITRQAKNTFRSDA